ncbi:MAG: acyloxyacyl hydrolase [Opitutaceae bacterium]|nr:acyloxyacyl hydrolase [Opitutaceae bacterium]
MNTGLTRLLTAVCVVLAATGAARAEWGPETVALGVGLEEVFDQEGRRAVYSAELGFTEWGAGLAPVAELNVTEAGAVFAGLGLAWRWEAEALPLGLRVGVAPGYYDQGRDKFLGGNFQVYSFIEAGWRVTKAHGLGLRLAHLSNASTADQNPGTEIVSLIYEFKLAGR